MDRQGAGRHACELARQATALEAESMALLNAAANLRGSQLTQAMAIRDFVGKPERHQFPPECRAVMLG